MIRPIAIGLAPNLNREDALLAIKHIFWPFSYNRGNSTIILEKWFGKYFSSKYTTAFTSGRGALFSVLKGLNITKGDEVIMQAFTCAAVVQAILSTGATPIYADILDTYTLDPEDIERLITKKTKAIIIQHTFGIPAELDKILLTAKKYKIYVIEDNAHSIGNLYKGKKLGTFGVASIFSFGRDKAFSSTSGGMSITNDKDLGEKIEKLASNKKYPNKYWTFQQLLHPIVFYFLILPFYNLFLGKVLLVLFQRLHLLSIPVDTTCTTISENDVKKLPSVLASLMLKQLESLEKSNEKRKQIVLTYEKKLAPLTMHVSTQPLLRYPLYVANPKQILRSFKRNGIYLGNWYSNTIDPSGVSLKKLQYTLGSCPNAEKIAQHIINLPTYASLSQKDIGKICKLFLKYVQY